MSERILPIDVEPRRGERRFFVWMAAYCVLLTFAGFTPTYWAPIASASLGELGPAVHMHGALVFSWMLLFLVQTALVPTGRIAIHRSLVLIGRPVGRFIPLVY